MKCWLLFLLRLERVEEVERFGYSVSSAGPSVTSLVVVSIIEPHWAHWVSMVLLINTDGLSKYEQVAVLQIAVISNIVYRPSVVADVAWTAIQRIASGPVVGPARNA
jgi:hypothetical protein